jgi:hypothetical protein
MVNAFEYFDDKNRTRVQNVKEKLSVQKDGIIEVKELVQGMRSNIKEAKSNYRRKSTYSKHHMLTLKGQKS